jgi:hypothetical protein
LCEAGELLEFIEGVMLEDVQHRQQGSQSRQQRGHGVWDAAFHLATAQTDERRSRRVRPGVLAAGDLPHRRARHAGRPQAASPVSCCHVSSCFPPDFSSLDSSLMFHRHVLLDRWFLHTQQ